MFDVDERLCSFASIDKTSAALVSATSLKTLARVFEENQVPDEKLEGLLLDPLGMVLANIIQTMVLHETVYADYVLFDRGDGLDRAERMFPGTIRRLFVPPKLRHEIARTIDSMSQNSPDFYKVNPSDKLLNTLLDRQTATKKPLFDALSHEKAGPFRVPPDLAADAELQQDKLLWESFGIHLAEVVLNSMNSEARTQYYLAACRT